jgi:hypothetical protein
MKMVKSLILGSAAGLVAMSGAQAADLPVKAKAVEYVRICSLYGAGFYYIPGTDTCIKLSGYLRVDVIANSNSDFTGNESPPAGLGNRFTNAYTWRSREDLDIDTRTATEYGVVRTFMDLTFSWTDDTYNNNGGAAAGGLGSTYGQIGVAGVGQANNGTSGAVAAGTLGVYYAFIQFAGFTMGKAISPFSSQFVNYPGNNYDGLVGGGGTVTGVNQFVYTAQFGGGVSGTLGVQDPTQYYQAGVLNFGPQGGQFGLATPGLGAAGVSDYAGTVFPDIVGNLTVDQAWGVAQLSVAAHDNNPAYYLNAPLGAASNGLGGIAGIQNGHPDDKWGFAVQGSLTIKNLPTGAGDTINLQAVYTDGATRYNIQDLAGSAGAWTTTNGSTIGFGVAPDSVFNSFGQQQLISTWGGRGAFNHNWNPYWSSAIYGAYADVHYGSGAAAVVCASVAATAAYQPIAGVSTGITSCNPNYSIGQIGAITRWTPVKNLTFSLDFIYQHLSQNYAGQVVAAGGSGTGVYNIADQNTYSAMFRAQRNW